MNLIGKKVHFIQTIMETEYPAVPSKSDKKALKIIRLFNVVDVSKNVRYVITSRFQVSKIAFVVYD